jgi:hypothetical protein
MKEKENSFKASLEASIDEIRAYVEENFMTDVQGKVIRKNPGPDVIIIDHMNILTNDKNKLQHTRSDVKQ